jgi:dephospho-CoA kinase
MFKVGITGGIGSGKTTVCKVFETLGVPVFYADQVAKELMVKDEILIDGVKAAFGSESYNANGVLNNKHIASIVFGNRIELDKLNALVHPAVFNAFDSWEKQVRSRVPYTLKEAALLFESGSYQMCDVNILVKAPLSLKMSRVMTRDGVSEAQVIARMDKQFTDEQKGKMADYFISNTESDSIILQVVNLHEKFLKQIKS